MYLKFILLFSLLNVFSCFVTNETVTDVGVVDVSYIADILLSLLGHDGKNETLRIQELKQKLAKIDSYVVDREKYIARLSNVSKLYFLNATNFYSALNEKDHYRFRNDSRNLYIKLKEKMNRDDLLQILAERGGKKTKKYARRMMEYIPHRRKEQEIDDAVDKFLGELAHDDHSFRAEDQYSKYWDPEPELKERESYYQPSGGRRIFKGERTNIIYYPFMTSIHIMGRFWCGGALYWNDIVLTSAACLQLLYNNRFYRENPKVLAVRIGSNHSRFGGEMVPALEVFFHPSYNPKTLDNNIAVIRLQRMVKLSYHRVPKLIPISDNDQGVPFTAEVLLLGWGVQRTSQKMVFEPMYLARKFLPVYPNKFCKEVYGEKFNMRTMFCVGTMSTGEGACAHDAGGPAILSGKVVGIISYGPAICGYPDAPTVLTLAGAYVDWIETINETMPEYYRANARTTTTTAHPYLMYFQSMTSKINFDNKDKKGAEDKKQVGRMPQKEPDTIEEMKEIMKKVRRLKEKKHLDEEETMKNIDVQIQRELDSISKNAARGKKDTKYELLSKEIMNPIASKENSKELARKIEENSKNFDMIMDFTTKAEKSRHKEVPMEIDPLTDDKNKVKDKKAKYEFDVASSSSENKKEIGIVKQQSFERSFSAERKMVNDSIMDKMSFNNLVQLSDVDDTGVGALERRRHLQSKPKKRNHKRGRKSQN